MSFISTPRAGTSGAPSPMQEKSSESEVKVAAGIDGAFISGADLPPDIAVPTRDGRGGSRAIFEQGLIQAVGGFNELQNDFLNKALDDYSSGIKAAITKKTGEITNQSIDVQQGFVAEAHHVGSYNIEAAAKGQNNHRATRDVGKVNDPRTDIRVKTPAGAKDYQSKYFKDGDSTAKALSDPKYDDVQKLAPADQIQEIKDSANRQAVRNQDSRPAVSSSYQDTHDKASGTIGTTDAAGTIESKAISRKGKNSSEALTKKAKSGGKGPKYKDQSQVRAQFNAMQYANAARSGAIAGASVTAAAELISFLGSERKYTKEECMAAAQQITLSAVQGAGKAMLATGIQHAGQKLIDTAANTALSSVGKQMGKGNVAAAIATVAVQLGQDLYRFSNGKMDSVELASCTIGGAMNAAGGMIAYSCGTATAAFVGQFVGSSIASVTVMGTTLGTLGPIGLGIAFSIGMSFAMQAYTGHFSKDGREIALADIKAAMASLNGGKVSLTEYAGLVGNMAQCEFRWKDLWPLSGSIAVFSEYKTRKGQLEKIHRDITVKLGSLPEKERGVMQELRDTFEARARDVEREYWRVRSDLTQQAFVQYDGMRAELDKDLEMKFLIFAPVRKHYQEEAAIITVKERKLRLEQARLEAYTEELQNLKQALVNDTLADAQSIRIKNAVLDTIQARLTDVLPDRTGWDEAYEFLVTNQPEASSWS